MGFGRRRYDAHGRYPAGLGAKLLGEYPNPVPFVFGRDFNPKGRLGGLQAGYNFQHGRTVYGVETDFTWAGQNSSVFLSGDTRPVKLQY